MQSVSDEQRVYSVSCFVCGEYHETDRGQPQPARPRRCGFCGSQSVDVAEVAIPMVRRDSRIGNAPGRGERVTPKPTLSQLDGEWA